MNRILVLLLFCWHVASGQLVDPKATRETRLLYKNLQRLSGKAILFGHQDALGYGVGWRGVPGKADVKEVTGEFPAVFGWDLGRIELDQPKEINGIPFDTQREFVRQVYEQGGVNTFCWHLNNPLFPQKTSWDSVAFTIRNVFADPVALQRYTGWLDRAATYFKSLKGNRGEAIPIIFRPFHEHTGSWFWWGKDHATIEEYVKLWRFTVTYLRDTKQVHNLLYAYSTDRFSSREEYLERYPGDAYVDIVGFDIYHRPKPGIQDTFILQTRQMVETLQQIGQEKRKVYAITETGLEKLTQADWWTTTLWPIIKDSGLSYVMVWRNGNPNHFYAPYPGQSSAADFRTFVTFPSIYLEKKTKRAGLYR